MKIPGLFECFDFSEEEIVEKLKDIYDENYYAEYVGGSITFMHKDELVILNVGNSNNQYINYWVAKNYLKYKSEDHYYFKKAKKDVENFRISMFGW